MTTRDHGSLSDHQAGPHVERHAEDVQVLLTEQRDEAARRLADAQQQRERADHEIGRWSTQVTAYDELLNALEQATRAIT